MASSEQLFDEHQLRVVRVEGTLWTSKNIHKIQHGIMHMLNNSVGVACLSAVFIPQSTPQGTPINFIEVFYLDCTLHDVMEKTALNYYICGSLVAITPTVGLSPPDIIRPRDEYLTVIPTAPTPIHPDAVRFTYWANSHRERIRVPLLGEIEQTIMHHFHKAVLESTIVSDDAPFQPLQAKIFHWSSASLDQHFIVEYPNASKTLTVCSSPGSYRTMLCAGQLFEVDYHYQLPKPHDTFFEAYPLPIYYYSIEEDTKKRSTHKPPA